jgi:hypothetical protein
MEPGVAGNWAKEGKTRVAGLGATGDDDDDGGGVVDKEARGVATGVGEGERGRRPESGRRGCFRAVDTPAARTARCAWLVASARDSWPRVVWLPCRRAAPVWVFGCY